MYKNHTHCRACGYAKSGAQGIKSAPGAKLPEVFSLGVQPLANDFRKSDEEHSGFCPLKVLLCPNCELAQLSTVVRPDILYRNYLYVTSPAEMMRQHFEQLIKDIAAETDGKSVLEIGSNDGKLLGAMQAAGYSTMGVDPAENLTLACRGRGIPVMVGFFGSQLAKSLPQSDIIIARHVFCHIDDWKDFIKGIEEISFSSTLVCIEVPYVGDLLKHCEFDTIYHEHLSYLSIKSVHSLLDDSSLRLYKILRYPIHGGAILLMLRRKDSGKDPDHSVLGFKDEVGLEAWKAFAVEARAQIDRLKATVQSLVAQGKRVAGLGASAKSTVWINACGFTRKDIAFIADNTPQKHWTFSPGSDIPITDEGAILRDLPDYVVMWAWNYRSELLEKFSLARSKGVKFIVPVPKVEIV